MRKVINKLISFLCVFLVALMFSGVKTVYAETNDTSNRCVLTYEENVVMGAESTITITMNPYAFRNFSFYMTFKNTEVKINNVEGVDGSYVNYDPEQIGEFVEIRVNNQIDSEEKCEIATIYFTVLVEGEVELEIETMKYTLVSNPLQEIICDYDKIVLSSVGDYDFNKFINNISVIDEEYIYAYLDEYRNALNEYNKFNLNAIKNEEVKVQINKMERCIKKYNDLRKVLNAVDERSENAEFLIRGGKDE